MQERFAVNALVQQFGFQPEGIHQKINIAVFDFFAYSIQIAGYFTHFNPRLNFNKDMWIQTASLV